MCVMRGAMTIYRFDFEFLFPIISKGDLHVCEDSLFVHSVAVVVNRRRNIHQNNLVTLNNTGLGLNTWAKCEYETVPMITSTEH